MFPLRFRQIRLSDWRKIRGLWPYELDVSASRSTTNRSSSIAGFRCHPRRQFDETCGSSANHPFLFFRHSSLKGTATRSLSTGNSTMAF